MQECIVKSVTTDLRDPVDELVTAVVAHGDAVGFPSAGGLLGSENAFVSAFPDFYRRQKANSDPYARAHEPSLDVAGARDLGSSDKSAQGAAFEAFLVFDLLSGFDFLGGLEELGGFRAYASTQKTGKG